MIAHVYLEGGVFLEGGEYATASAEARASSLSKESEFVPLGYAKGLNDIWHEKIISHNLRVALVENIARDYVNYGVALAELIKEGNMGLSHALSNFELEGGSRFSTYAARCIRHSIVRAIMNRSETKCASGVAKIRQPKKVADSNIHRQQMA
jgi:DNA-directed RNA polymerase sigma subunit (sigma70/sigma32)